MTAPERCPTADPHPPHRTTFAPAIGGETFDCAGVPVLADHSYESVAAGGPGECGAACSCGLTFDGFDTLREALALLDGHIADSQPDAPAPTLVEFVRDAERLAHELITALSRQYDPARALDDNSEVDAYLACAISLAQGALNRIQEAVELIGVPA